MTSNAHLCGENFTAPERLRRNIAVSGINLTALRNCKFRLGDAMLERTGLCSPVELELGYGGFNAMRGHGGITARILTGGPVSVG